MLLALLAGMLGGAGGAYLLYLHLAADKGQLNARVAASSPEAAQARTAALAVPPGIEVKFAPVPVTGPTAATATAAAPEVPTAVPDGTAVPARSAVIATASVPPVPTESVPVKPQANSSPVAPASPAAPSITPLAKQEPHVAISSPTAATDPNLAPATPPVPAAVPAEKGVSVTAYLSNGELLLRRGDVASARLFYEAAANSGSAAAMTAIGRTYDPLELSRLSIKGILADPAKAADWYLKAKEHGDSEAVGQISRLQHWLAEASGAK